MGETVNRGRILTYQARTVKPLAVWSLNDDKTRTCPGGALVTITENREPRTEGGGVDPIFTLTVVIDGVYYSRHLMTDGSQYTRITE